MMGTMGRADINNKTINADEDVNGKSFCYPHCCSHYKERGRRRREILYDKGKHEVSEVAVLFLKWDAIA
ncbi:hypothetical protein BHE74_00054644 [Ensete ventricosum]|nr:hypothetical protein BHE74_00054644 [Ensete ventricosum]